MNENEPITVLKGIGSKTAEKFASAGIFTVGDLIHYYPRTYDMFEAPAEPSSAADGRKLAVCGLIPARLSVRFAGKYRIVTGTIQTEREKIPVTWFNMPYLRGTIEPGRRYVFRGTVKKKGRQLTLTQPSVYSPEEYEQKRSALQPVYPLHSGLKDSTLRRAIALALEGEETVRDIFPESIRSEYHLAQAGFALRQIHFPDDLHHCLLARERLVFEEFLLFILALRRLKDSREEILHDYRLSHVEWTDRVLKGLPYSLTDAQMRVWQQVEKDLGERKVMSRLVQGDVGSGKTIIAFLALLTAAGNGGQAALMAPTEVLARQHYEAFGRLADRFSLPVRTQLLTGSMTAKEKREAYRMIENGECDVVIGTHALIQEKTVYRNLTLVITDEQHRFGVQQREALFEKGQLPHVLIMSATPIPRTLAVILYGDLDVSVIDEMPPGRIPVKNCVVNTDWRPKAWDFIRREVEKGQQAYVICPMVEESDMMEAENVIDYTQTLRGNLPSGVTVEYLHGKMKPAEKNEIMERFVTGQTRVLVSTTVIEVGVNVPNATVMLIEDAQRFGLAQLHQLRGRVGRGNAQAYCIMIDTSGREEADARLQIMNRSNDGFWIARKDLELRGPGDLFGIRQSGVIDFRIADVFADAAILEKANEAAKKIQKMDPHLSMNEHEGIRRKLESLMENGIRTGSL